MWCSNTPSSSGSVTPRVFNLRTRWTGEWIALRPLSPVRETPVPVGRENGRPRADLPVVQETQITGPVQNRTKVSLWSTPSRSCCSHWLTQSLILWCAHSLLVFSVQLFLSMLWSHVGEGSLAPLILNLRNRRRWIVCFTLRRLYPHERSEWAPQSV